MGKSTPKAPDYTGAAEATAASNQEALNQQTWANRINQYNPWGSVEYTPESVIDPSTGQQVTQWTQNQQLTPLAQEALDRQMGIDAQKSDFASQLMGRAGDKLLQDTDWSKFGDFAQAPVAYGMREVQQTPAQIPTQPPAQPQPPAEFPTQAPSNGVPTFPDFKAQNEDLFANPVPSGGQPQIGGGGALPTDPKIGKGMEARNKYGNKYDRMRDLGSLLGMLRNEEQ